MANLKFVRGVTIPSYSTTGFNDGCIYFNTSNKKIYLRNGSALDNATVVVFDGSPAPVVTAILTCSFFDITSNTQSPMYGQERLESGETAGYLKYTRWPITDYVNFYSSSFGYESFIRVLWNTACTAYNDHKMLLVYNTADEFVSVCNVSVVTIPGHDSTTYALRVSGMKDGNGNIMAVEMSRGLTTKTFQTTTDATIMVQCCKSYAVAI